MALEAASTLHKEGISCQVLDVFSIKPIDDITLEKAARHTGRILTCEEHNIIGGMGSAVAESVSSSYPVIVRRVGVNDTFGESARDAQVPELLAQHGLSSINITKQVRELVR